MRLRKARGIGLEQYLFWIGVGVVITFYSFNPVLKELEARRKKRENDSALEAIERANKQD